jgi:hypothetical protein
MRVNCGQRPVNLRFDEQRSVVILEGQEPEEKIPDAAVVVPCKPSRHRSLAWRRELAMGKRMMADMPLKARTEDLTVLARAL